MLVTAEVSPFNGVSRSDVRQCVLTVQMNLSLREFGIADGEGIGIDNVHAAKGIDDTLICCEVDQQIPLQIFFPAIFRLIH